MTMAREEELLSSLRAIEDIIGEAIDHKIRTGRMPNIGALLSTIQDTARHAIDDYEYAMEGR